MMTGDNSTVKIDPEPELRRSQIEPRGVLQRNLKMLVYLGGAILVVVAAFFSSTGTKTQATKGQPPQPMVQDNTDNNVQDLKNQRQAEQQKGQPHATVPNPDYVPGGRYFGCVPGQVCTPEMLQQNPQAQQLTPEQQQEQQLAAKDRELAYNARFASNIAYSRPSDPPPGSTNVAPEGYRQAIRRAVDPNSSLVGPRAASDPDGQGQGQKHAPEVNVDSAVGQPYVLYEGTTLDAVLMNRLDGDAEIG